MKKKLITVLVMALGFMSFAVGCSKTPYSYVYNHVYKNESDYSVGDFTYKGSDINKVNVNWAFGNVTVVEDDGEELTVSESNNNLTEEQKMRYLISNGVLNIQFCKSGYNGDFKGVEKKLTVKIPKGIKVDIETLSANINLNDANPLDLELESSSGKIEIENVVVQKELSAKSSSGQIDISKIKAESVEVESSSGEIIIKEATAQKNVELESLSGNIEADDMIANKIEAESSSGKIIMHKANAPSIEIESTSGMITIESITTTDVKIEASSGAIHADMLDCQSINITTSSGNVYLSLNGLGMSSLNHKTGSGKLHLSDNVSTTGGKVAVTVKTSSGNIDID